MSLLGMLAKAAEAGLFLQKKAKNSLMNLESNVLIISQPATVTKRQQFLYKKTALPLKRNR